MQRIRLVAPPGLPLIGAVAAGSPLLADFLIIAVPTPVDAAHAPNFGPLIAASSTVGQHMKLGATVVYESTVSPGATEEVCIPVLEQHSGGRWQRDFYVGYSPERINPGDHAHTLTSIVKVVAGDTPATLESIVLLYGSIVSAGVHRAPSIKVAEAAKVIENTQRDLNIALMNELAIIFDKLGIDTAAVLEAAGAKWNFHPFRSGLVGGHCMGVDPYYLTRKAERLGYHPQVILAGRRFNDGMGKFIAEKTVPPEFLRQGCPSDRPRSHLQGRLRRLAQQQGDQCHPGVAGLRLRRNRARSPRRPAAVWPDFDASK